MPEKFLKHDLAGGLVEAESAAAGGAGSANKIPSLDASGRLPATMMPTGVGAETSSLEAFGALAAGDLVNAFNDGGVMKVRKADASSNIAPANGFVLEAYTTGQMATVYWSGLNNMRSGMTPGPHYLSTTPGTTNHVAPSASGNVVQLVGIATSSTVLLFEPKTPITLA